MTILDETSVPFLRALEVGDHTASNTQLSAVTKGRHAAVGLDNSTQIVSVIRIELDFDDVPAGICEFPSKFSV